MSKYYTVILGFSVPWGYPLPVVIKKIIPMKAETWRGAKCGATRIMGNMLMPYAVVHGSWEKGFTLDSYRPVAYRPKVRKTPWVDYNTPEKRVEKHEHEQFLDIVSALYDYPHYFNMKGGRLHD